MQSLRRFGAGGGGGGGFKSPGEKEEAWEAFCCISTPQPFLYFKRPLSNSAPPLEGPSHGRSCGQHYASSSATSMSGARAVTERVSELAVPCPELLRGSSVGPYKGPCEWCLPYWVYLSLSGFKSCRSSLIGFKRALFTKTFFRGL